MRELLLASSSTMAGSRLPFLNALEKYLPLFAFRSFGVAFGLELRLSELSPGTAAGTKKRKSAPVNEPHCFLPQSYTFRSSPSRMT